MKPIFSAAFAAALALASVACQAQGAGPTDPQIAAIVVTANQVDIDAGQLAASKARRARSCRTRRFRLLWRAM